MKLILFLFIFAAMVTTRSAMAAAAVANSPAVTTAAFDPPPVNPDDIRDGIVRTIDPSAIKDIADWAGSSKTTLSDGDIRIRDLPREERREEYKKLIKDVLPPSGDMQTELLMRSVLKRADLFDDLLRTEEPSPEQETLALRLLESSVKWAIKLYASDDDFLKRAAGEKEKKPIVIDLDFADLGIKHAKYVLANIWIAPSIDAKLILLKESLTLFFNDLNRDIVARRNRTIANVLVKIANYSDRTGLTKKTDAEFLQGLSGLTDLQKLDVIRKIESFYAVQIKTAAEVPLGRNEPESADVSPENNAEREERVAHKECPGDKFCVGGWATGHAVGGYDYAGIVTKVFDNGQIEIHFLESDKSENTNETNYWRSDNLSRESRCVKGICRNETIFHHEIGGYDYVGYVKRAFENGVFEIVVTKKDGKPISPKIEFWSFNNISKEIH